MKKAFTLLEVNLAMFVMAMGVLAMIGLYPLGFREAEQSREDVAAATYCESVLNSLSAALSSTNIAWSKWAAVARKQKTVYPDNAWRDYFQDGRFSRPKTLSSMRSTAEQTFNKVINDLGANGYGVKPPSAPQGLGCALVVEFDGTRCGITARATRRPGMLLAQPLFYTAVNFQGDVTK